MKKVVLVCSKLGNGGIEHLAAQWYSHMKDEVEFSFAVFNDGGYYYDFFLSEKRPIYKLVPLRQIGLFGYIRQFRDTCRAENADIIHVPASKASYLALLGAIAAGCKKRIIHAHTNDYMFKRSSGIAYSLKLWFVRLMNNTLSNVKLTASREAAEHCFGENRTDVIMIKNGIDVDRFSQSGINRSRIRESLGVDQDFVLGSVGRLCYQKNQRFAIDILSALVMREEKVSLLLFGEGEDESDLREYVELCQLNEKVHFCGVTENLAPYYHAMDVFVFPSRFEGLGIAAVEAQAAGTIAFVSENVPDEALISKECVKMSLSDGPDQWALAIWSKRDVRITDGRECAVKNGYDMNYTINQVLGVYLA